MGAAVSETCLSALGRSRRLPMCLMTRERGRWDIRWNESWKSLGLGLCKEKYRNTCEQEESANQGKLEFGLPGVPASRTKNGDGSGHRENTDSKDREWIINVHIHGGGGLRVGGTGTG